METRKSLVCKTITTETTYFSWIKTFSIVSSIVIFFFSASSFASTFTVGNGKEYSSIQAAINNASCGDTIDIYSGTYAGNVEVDVLGETCNSDNYLTIRAAENGVILDGNKTYYAVKIMEPYTRLDGNSYVLNITGGAMNNPYGSWAQRYTGAIHIDHANYVTVNDVHVKGTVGGDNPDCYGTNPSCSVSDLWITTSDYVTIQNSSFTSRYAKYSINVESTSNYLTFKNNVVGDSSYITTRFYHVDNAIIEKNYIYQTFDPRSAISGLFVRDSVDVTIRYNIIEAVGDGNFAAVFFDDSSCTSSENWDIYNNIFINGPVYINNQGSCGMTGLTFKNNIFSYSSEPIIFDGANNSGVTFDYNLWDGCSSQATCVAELRSASYTWDQNPIYGSPDFSGGDKPLPYFKPSNKSASQLDRGINVGYTGTDYQGNKVPIGDAPDIGAIEYISSDLIADLLPPNPPLLISID